MRMIIISVDLGLQAIPTGLPPSPMNTSELITDADALQARVGKLPGPRDLKVIDYLDDNAIRWIAAAPIGFAVCGTAGNIEVTACGGHCGFVRVAGPKQLSIPMALMDSPHIACAGGGFGSLFFVPGIDETLRVNGRIAQIHDGHIHVAVEECYLHCAKALMRSEFWAAPERSEPETPEPLRLLQASRFMALGTIDDCGHADLSPKGDPAGALLRLIDGDVVYPDRPGNRRVDSFRNILTQPRVAAMSLVPGSADVSVLTGVARIVANETLCAAFEVLGKTPRLVTRVEQVQIRSYRSEALQRARLWPATRTHDDLDPADIFKAHVKLNRIGGMAATITRAAVSIPGLMRKALQDDYKNNLY